MKKYLIVIICLLLTSCYHPNKQWYEDRDTIHFNDSVEKVEANIVKLNSLFDKIKDDYNDSINLHYSWDTRDTNVLHLCDTSIIGLNANNIDNISYTKSLSKEEKEEFVRLIYYLRSNFLTDMGSGGKGDYSYEYRFIENDSFFTRSIFYYDKNVDTTNMSSVFRFLDRKGNLMLIKYKD